MLMRGGEEEAVAPKYAHLERERRFLVLPDRRPDLSAAPFVRMEDRYITNTRMRLRRMTDSATGRVVMKLGKKYEAADPLARPIVTTYLTKTEYDLLATLPATTITKRSYAVEGASGRWRIDLFEGALAGLETAEFDADNDAALRATVPEPWCGREVSLDPQYQGGELALLSADDLASLRRG